MMTDWIAEEIEKLDREEQLKEIRNRPILAAMPRFWSDLKRVVQSKVNSFGGGLEYEERDRDSFEVHETGSSRKRMVVKNEAVHLSVWRSTIFTDQSREEMMELPEDLDAKKDEKPNNWVILLTSKGGEEFRTPNDAAKYLFEPFLV